MYLIRGYFSGIGHFRRLYQYMYINTIEDDAEAQEYNAMVFAALDDDGKIDFNEFLRIRLGVDEAQSGGADLDLGVVGEAADLQAAEATQADSEGAGAG